MFAVTAKNEMLDRMAIGLSGLCLVHCLGSTIFLALVSAAGGLLLDPVIHEIGLVLAIGLGIVALGRGIVEHGFILPAVIGSYGLNIMAGSLTMPHDGIDTFSTIIGVTILSIGHYLNRRASI